MKRTVGAKGATTKKTTSSRSLSNATSSATSKSSPVSPATSFHSAQQNPLSGTSKSNAKKSPRTLGTGAAVGSNNNKPGATSGSTSPRTLGLSGNTNSPRGGPSKNKFSTSHTSKGGAGGGGSVAGASGSSRLRTHQQPSPRHGDIALVSDLEDMEQINREEQRIAAAEKKEQRRQERKQRKDAKIAAKSKLEKLRVARASKSTKIPLWLMVGAAEILESFDHPADIVTLMATNRQVKDKFILPYVHEQFGAISASFVLSSKEVLPPVSNPRPAKKLEEKIASQLKKQFDVESEKSTDDDANDSDDDFGIISSKKKNKNKSLLQKEDTGLFDENQSDEDDDDEFEDEGHAAESLLQLFSTTRHVLTTKTQVFNLSGASLPDKKSGETFFRSVLTPVLDSNETVKRAEFSLLPVKFLDAELEPTTFPSIEGGTAADEDYYSSKTIPFVKTPLGGELRDIRFETAIKENPDVGLVNDRTISLLGQRNHDLRYLDVSGRSAITGVGISVVACCCTHLLHLNLAFTSVTDSSMCLVASYCRRLKNLSVEGCSKLTDRAVSSISIWCPQLIALNVSKTKGTITDFSVGEIIARCHSLERLVAHSCGGGISDATLMALTKPPFVTNASFFTERELSPDNSPARNQNNNNSVDSSSSPINDSTFFGVHGGNSVQSHNSGIGNDSSSNNKQPQGISQKTQASCLWTTLKEVDIRGSKGKVTWAGGLLNLLQHTATEQTKRHRINLRRARLNNQVKENTANTPQLLVYVDVEVLDELPEDSAVIQNIKPMLKFVTVEEF